MSLDFSNWLRDDAHARARERLCPDRLAGVRHESARMRRSRRLRRFFALARLLRPGAVALVADVVMVSVAAAVAIVAAQSIAPDDAPKTATSNQLQRIGETP